MSLSAAQEGALAAALRQLGQRLNNDEANAQAFQRQAADRFLAIDAAARQDRRDMIERFDRFDTKLDDFREAVDTRLKEFCEKGELKHSIIDAKLDAHDERLDGIGLVEAERRGVRKALVNVRDSVTWATEHGWMIVALGLAACSPQAGQIIGRIAAAAAPGAVSFATDARAAEPMPGRALAAIPPADGLRGPLEAP